MSQRNGYDSVRAARLDYSRGALHQLFRAEVPWRRIRVAMTGPIQRERAAVLTRAAEEIGESGSVDAPARKKQKGRLLFTSVIVNDANSAYVSEGHVGPRL
jgi:hypothetical protein